MKYSLIATELIQNTNFEDCEEVTSVAEKGSIRRCEIIAIDKIKRLGVILDPAIKYEIGSEIKKK